MMTELVSFDIQLQARHRFQCNPPPPNPPCIYVLEWSAIWLWALNMKKKMCEGAIGHTNSTELVMLRTLPYRSAVAWLLPNNTAAMAETRLVLPANKETKSAEVNRKEHQDKEAMYDVQSDMSSFWWQSEITVDTLQMTCLLSDDNLK